MKPSETESFAKTLSQLESFLAEPIVNDRDRAGIIRAFEFTFEQSWRSIQKMSATTGGQVGNAKQAYAFAIQSGWISRSTEDDWIRMIEDRNLTSHTYQRELANQILDRVTKTYLKLFEDLLRRLELEV